jgi:hypothetical protein
MKPRRDWKKVVDQLCYCGRKKSEHLGVLHHLGCLASNCERFTWKCFIDKNGKKV